MILTEKSLKKIIRNLIYEQSDGDYHQSQIESYSRGKKSFKKIDKAIPIRLMTHYEFTKYLGSIGCFWGDYYDGSLAGNWSDDRIKNTTSHTKKEWNSMMRKTNKISGRSTGKYTVIQAGDDLYYVPFLYFRNKAIFIHGPIDNNQLEVIKYRQLFDNDGVFIHEDRYSSSNIPSRVTTGLRKGEWTKMHQDKGKRGNSKFIDQSYNRWNSKVREFLSSNARLFKSGQITYSNRSEQDSESKWSKATPSGEVKMTKPPRPSFKIPSASTFTWKLDDKTGVYKIDSSKPLDKRVELSRMLRDPAIKEELDKIMADLDYKIDTSREEDPKIRITK